LGFSSDWDKTYRSKKQWSVWPWSDVVRYVMRYAYPIKNCKVLEIGCGAGANIPFFKSIGYDYYGIDGSSTIIGELKKRFPSLKENLIKGDFTKCIPFDEKFNIILDRSGINHNTSQGVEQAIQLVYDKMNLIQNISGLIGYPPNIENT